MNIGCIRTGFRIIRSIIQFHLTDGARKIMSKFQYPRPHKVDQIDDYHGTKIPDPYRWLEDVDSPETLEWIKQENELTFSFLEKIPAQKKIKEKLTRLWDFAKASSPIKKGNRYFQFRNSGLQNQDTLFVSESLAEDA